MVGRQSKLEKLFLLYIYKLEKLFLLHISGPDLQ